MSIKSRIFGWILKKELANMAKNNEILKWLDGKKMYLGTGLYFLAQGLRALNPVVLKPLLNLEVPESVIKVVEDIGIGLGAWGATHKIVKLQK